jgi:hypothetical protein
MSTSHLSHRPNCMRKTIIQLWILVSGQATAYLMQVPNSAAGDCKQPSRTLADNILANHKERPAPE